MLMDKAGYKILNATELFLFFNMHRKLSVVCVDGGLIFLLYFSIFSTKNILYNEYVLLL